VHPLHIVYLNGPDIARLALSDAEILAAVNAGLTAQGRGEVVLEPRVHLVPVDSAVGHFNVLRGVIHASGLAGVEVVGDFVNNHEIGLPSEIGLLTLFDPATGVPLALINATSITVMRTGAMTAIGASYLARKSSKILGHIGARGSAYWNIRLLCQFFDFDEIRVHSKQPQNRRALAAKLTTELGKRVIAVDDWEHCVRDADIVVEATRLPEPSPLLKTEWIKRGALVVSYGTMNAVELTLADVMDKVVVDDWDQREKGGRFGALRQENLHAELGQIVAKLRPGRQSDAETILFWHRGLALSDIALGGALLDKAGALSIGQTLRFE